MIENDIIFLSEHWLHNNKLNLLSEVSNDFNCFGRASSRSSEESFGLRRGQGGVAIFWKKGLKGISVIETMVHSRICGIRMEREDNSALVFISVYMPAAGSRDNLSVTLDELGAFLEELGEGVVPIVGGDFNGNMGIRGGPRANNAPTKAGIAVHEFAKSQNLIATNLMRIATGQVDTYVGHNGSSLIDYIFVPEYLRSKIIKSHTGKGEALNTSDHLPIEVTIDVGALPRTVNFTKTSKRLRWDKCPGDFIGERYQEPIRQELHNVRLRLEDNVLSHLEIDACVDNIINTLHRTAESIPKSKFVTHLKPYWNDRLSLLKKNKMSWFNRWKAEGRTNLLDDPVRQEMLKTKKLFNKELHRISRLYHDNLMAEAASKAEINHKDFWGLLKKTKSGNQIKVNTIRNQQGKVVYETDEILEVWRSHFDRLSTPKFSDSFDDAHFQYVTRRIREFRALDDESPFLSDPITECEVENAVRKLNNNKAPGYDGITSEHIKYAGHPLVRILCLLYRHCIRSEYIPLSLRKGIQIPLYKGKNTCTLDCDNYRGITLLSTFNKLLEVIIWGRLKGWWFNDRIVSDLQGAGRGGHSCIHTALTLQETISKEREGNKKVFVAFYDVSKAFDSVWIDGLFYQLHKMGIVGSLWRILYKMYIGFLCCVRIGDRTSGWFSMDCGIHQGGYLSLMKYTAFINLLLTTLEESNLCSTIYRIKSSPVGYADDMATSSTSKNSMDRIMSVVYAHGRKWRYSFNAGKSAVLVFGETPAERRVGSSARVFKLAPERVKESLYYDHVGVKTCVKGDTFVRTEEKVSKARKCLNMSTSIGIKRGGINIKTCNVIYWSVVLPTLCFGCEIWFIKQKDIDILLAFQRYAARRVQRLHPRSLNITSVTCLGWMSIINYIKARKLIF